HAGIYYPKGSLKATSCVEGKRLLYEYCVAHGVPHRRSGKLIVASDEKQLPELQEIQRKAHANGVTDVVWMTREQALALEPELHCVAALYSPSTDRKSVVEGKSVDHRGGPRRRAKSWDSRMTQSREG